MKGPFLGFGNGSILIVLPVVGDRLIKGVIQVWKRHQSLDGEEHGSDLQCWRPLVLEDIKADSAELINVGVVDLGSEEHLWWDHWVLIRQEEFAVEDASLIWSFSWTSDLNEEVSEVLLVWLGVDSNNWILSESLSFL